MKKYGVSLVQFVITGNKKQLDKFLSILEPKEHNEMISEYSCLEDYLESLYKEEEISYAGLDKLKLQKSDYIRAQRHYDDGKPTKTTISEAMYRSAKELVKPITVFKSKNIDYSKLTESQKSFIARVNEVVYNRYNRYDFKSSKVYIEATSSNFKKIFNIDYNKSVGILMQYRKFEKSDSTLLAQNLLNINKLLTHIDNASKEEEMRKRQSVVRDITTIITQTSKIDDLLSVIQHQEKIEEEDIIKCLYVLRHSGLVGLDLHADWFANKAENIKMSGSIAASEANILHLKLLARDIESLLYY